MVSLCSGQMNSGPESCQAEYHGAKGNGWIRSFPYNDARHGFRSVRHPLREYGFLQDEEYCLSDDGWFRFG